MTKQLPAKIYDRPNDKRKVESGTKFAKSNFTKGRTFVSGFDLDHQLKVWNIDKNNRIITLQILAEFQYQTIRIIKQYNQGFKIRNLCRI